MKLKRSLVAILFLVTAVALTSDSYAAPKTYVDDGHTPTFNYFNDEVSGVPGSYFDADNADSVKRMGYEVSNGNIYFSINSNVDIEKGFYGAPGKRRWAGDLIIAVYDKGDSFSNYMDCYIDDNNTPTVDLDDVKHTIFNSSWGGSAYALALKSRTDADKLDPENSDISMARNVEAGVLYGKVGSTELEFRTGNYDDYERDTINSIVTAGYTSCDRLNPEDPFDDNPASIDKDENRVNSYPTVITSGEEIWRLQDDGYSLNDTNLQQTAGPGASGSDWFNQYEYNFEGWLPIEALQAEGKHVELWWTMTCGNDAMMVSFDVPVAPEPASALLFLLGAPLIGFLKRKKA